MRAIALLLLTTLPAAGQGFDPDFDRVFADHAAEVQSPAPGIEVLELPGPVVLTRQGGYVTAQDQSAWGPAGCALKRLALITAAVQLCPMVLAAEERDRLPAQLLRAAQFAADNTVPPLDAAARDAALEALLVRGRAAQEGLCPGDGADPGWVGFAGYLASEPAMRRFARIFDQPRLPVATDCP